MTNIIVQAQDMFGTAITPTGAVSAEGVRAVEGLLILPGFTEFTITAGDTLRGVRPGRAIIRLAWGNHRTATFRVNIPDQPEITLADLIRDSL